MNTEQTSKNIFMYINGCEQDISYGPEISSHVTGALRIFWMKFKKDNNL